MRRTFFPTMSLVILALFASFAPMPALAFPLRARALFIGDIMAHKQQLDAAATGRNGSREWDFAPQFRRVRPLFGGDALIVGNLETTFAGPERGYAGYPSFNTPDSRWSGWGSASSPWRTTISWTVGREVRAEPSRSWTGRAFCGRGWGWTTFPKTTRSWWSMGG